MHKNKEVFIISTLIALYMCINVLLIGFFTGKWNGLDGVFPLYFILTVPVVTGLSLVKNPMKALVLGCRIATIVFALFSIYSLIENSAQRAGFGTNAIIAAYFLMVFACVSRFQIKDTEQPKVGVIYFYLGFISAVATGTRIVILFYITAIVLEVFFIIHKAIRKNGSAGKNIALVFLLSCVFAFLLIKYSDVLRLESSLTAITSGNILLDGAIKQRLYMWEFGWNTFLQNSLLGIGAANIHGEVSVYMKQVHNISFAARHLHNVFIHELAAHGIIGAGLLLVCHYLVYNRTIGYFKGLPNKHSLYLLFLGILIYGLTGSHLTDDRMILITIFVFAVLIKTTEKLPKPSNPIQ
ncbi:O-antigen ligase family protein [Lentilitoribacter sp. EG35]|uniref:O-antigen ligase family protein n=1 Tax=Lentilitoribacter sp. EG35 TaxID=3234192 RepID=UPI00345F6F2E